MYLCRENKGADQLPSYCEADLRLCFRIGKNPVSHDKVHAKDSRFLPCKRLKVSADVGISCISFSQMSSWN